MSGRTTEPGRNMIRRWLAAALVGAGAGLMVGGAITGDALAESRPAKRDPAASAKSASAEKPAPGGAPSAAPPSAAIVVADLPPSPFLVDARALTEERAVNKSVLAARDMVSRAVGGGLAIPGTAAELALREAAMVAVQKNLDIRRRRIAKSIAERAVDEARAVFEPTFVVSLSSSLQHSFMRRVYTDKYKPATLRVPLGQTVSMPTDPNVITVNGAAAPSQESFTCTSGAASVNIDGTRDACFIIIQNAGNAVTYQQYSKERAAGYYHSQIYKDDGTAVVEPSPYQPRMTTSAVGSLTIMQMLPWGSSLQFNLSTTRSEKYYALNVNNGLPKTYGIYHRPYTSSFSASASIPLPYTKNFGPTAAADMNIEVSRHNVDLAELDVQSIINSTLLEVDSIYWRMVGAVLRLRAAEDSVALARKQRDSILNLFRQQLVTESDKARAESQVSRIQASQQQIFSDYLSASEAMHHLLNSDEHALLLPVGYQAVINGGLVGGYDPEQISNNPTYQRQAVAVRIAGLARSQREAQDRPNVALSGSYTLSQGGAFGYPGVLDSLTNVFNEDRIAITAGLLYQYPLGERAAGAALKASSHLYNQQELALRKIEQNVRADYENAHVEMASAKERVKIAERNLKLSEELYQTSMSQQELGLVPAYESLSRLSAVLDARTTLIQARIDLRTAESRLLASLGSIAERYGERTAQTDDDRARLAQLHNSGALKHFGGPL